MDNGLTIQDSEGNQYVWVEVPRTAEVYSTAGLEIKEFTDEEYNRIESDLHEYTKDYRENEGKDEYYSDETTGLTRNQYYELKKKMLKSVYRNGGFYVGKYETGIEDKPKIFGSADEVPVEIPVIKKNVYPYNNVTCSQAQVLANSMESGNYTSSLMLGVQWDLVLKYLEIKGVSKADLRTDSTSWGNYQNNLWNITNVNSKYAIKGLEWTSRAYGKKETNESILLSTGANDDFCKQGIYDLAGNVYEWTLEYTSYSNVPCTFRGSSCNSYGDSYPVVYRNAYITTLYDGYIGFRVSIF